MIRVRLSTEQCDELRKRTRQRGITPRTRDRLEMIRLSDAGWRIPRIAQYLGLHHQTVRKYIKAFLDSGFDSLVDGARSGRPATVKTEHLDALERLLDESTRTWTAPQLVEWLKQAHHVTISQDHLRRLLKQRRFRWKRTKNSVKHKQRNADLQAAQEAELEDLKKSGQGTGD